MVVPRAGFVIIIGIGTTKINHFFDYNIKVNKCSIVKIHNKTEKNKVKIYILTKYRGLCILNWYYQMWKNNGNNKKQSNWYHQTKNIGIITYIVMEGKCI